MAIVCHDALESAFKQFIHKHIPGRDLDLTPQEIYYLVEKTIDINIEFHANECEPITLAYSLCPIKIEYKDNITFSDVVDIMGLEKVLKYDIGIEIKLLLYVLSQYRGKGLSTFDGLFIENHAIPFMYLTNQNSKEGYVETIDIFQFAKNLEIKIKEKMAEVGKPIKYYKLIGTPYGSIKLSSADIPYAILCTMIISCAFLAKIGQ